MSRVDSHVLVKRSADNPVMHYGGRWAGETLITACGVKGAEDNHRWFWMPKRWLKLEMCVRCRKVGAWPVDNESPWPVDNERTDTDG
jgi:hypothetical protein